MGDDDDMTPEQFESLWSTATPADVTVNLRRPRIVCPGCNMSTWKDGFGCCLPGCENYGVLGGES